MKTRQIPVRSVIWRTTKCHEIKM